MCMHELHCDWELRVVAALSLPLTQADRLEFKCTQNSNSFMSLLVAQWNGSEWNESINYNENETRHT